MARFHYSARDAEGKKREGFVEAETEQDALMSLRSQGLLPVVIRGGGDRGGSAAAGGEKKPTRGKVGMGEVAIFSRQLATMLDAGVPIIDILADLATQTTNRYFAVVLAEIRGEIQGGQSLSHALARYPRIFSELYVALIRSGEESGNLVRVMEELASNLEDTLALIRKVRQALSYPAVIVAFFVGVVGFVFFFLIPKFAAIFASFNAELPIFTRVILKISQLGLKFAPVGIVLIVLASFFLSWYGKTPTGRRQIDGAKLRMPLLGQILLKVSLARFARSLATLLAGGVSISLSLEIVAKTAGNAVLEDVIEVVRRGIMKGEILGVEMRRHKIFPPMLTRMVAVGEETGRLEDMLNRVSKFFNDEVDSTLGILTSIMEPILIIGLGGVVGVVVLAIYLPIFKLAQSMK